MNHRGGGRFQPKIAAIAVDAGVVGEFVGVPAKVELIVGLEEIPRAENQLRFIVALEARARGDVEDPVRTIAVVGGVAAALDFESVNVLGVDLGPHVACDVGVGNGHAVDEPAHLMPAANVKLVVCHVRAGNKVGDHREAVRPRSSGRFLNLQSIDKARWCNGFRLTGVGGNSDGLVLRWKLEFQVENWRSAREYGDRLLVGHERRVGYVDDIFAQRDGVEVKFPGGVGQCGLRIV